MIKYTLRQEDGCVGRCDRCGSPSPTVECAWDDFGKSANQIPRDRKPKELLCPFCYETELGNLLKYDHYREQRAMARALAQAFNLLMRRLDGSSKK